MAGDLAVGQRCGGADAAEVTGVLLVWLRAVELLTASLGLGGTRGAWAWCWAAQPVGIHQGPHCWVLGLLG